MKNDHCKQYTLTTKNYREISLTPFTTDYFLLVTHVSHTIDGLEKRYRVVHNNNFKIIPMQSWIQCNDQVNMIEEMYDISLSNPIENILLGGQCACMNRKLTIELEAFCISGNILFTRIFNVWLWTIFLNQPLISPKQSIDITIIDTNINEITLDTDEYIEITPESYKRHRKTI
jgi:hypothetical protein